MTDVPLPLDHFSQYSLMACSGKLCNCHFYHLTRNLLEIEPSQIPPRKCWKKSRATDLITIWSRAALQLQFQPQRTIKSHDFIAITETGSITVTKPFLNHAVYAFSDRYKQRQRGGGDFMERYSLNKMKSILVQSSKSGSECHRTQQLQTRIHRETSHLQNINLQVCVQHDLG